MKEKMPSQSRPGGQAGPFLHRGRSQGTCPSLIVSSGCLLEMGLVSPRACGVSSGPSVGSLLEGSGGTCCPAVGPPSRIPKVPQGLDCSIWMAGRREGNGFMGPPILWTLFESSPRAA